MVQHLPHLTRQWKLQIIWRPVLTYPILQAVQIKVVRVQRKDHRAPELIVPYPATLTLDAPVILIRDPLKHRVDVGRTGGLIKHLIHVKVVQHEPAHLRVRYEAQRAQVTVSSRWTMNVMIKWTDQSENGEKFGKNRIFRYLTFSQLRLQYTCTFKLN